MPQNYKNQPSINRFNFCKWYQDKNLVANGEFELGSGNNFTNWTKTIPTHTNLLRHSQDFSNSVWTDNLFGNWLVAPVTANTTIAPDGTLTADTISITEPIRNRLQRVAVVANTTYTYTIYVKAVVGANYNEQLVLRVAIGNSGVLVNENFKVLNISNLISTTNWARFDIELTIPNSGVNQIEVGISGLNAFSINADVYIWGAQLEVGTKATKYIPTTTTAVTEDDGEIIAATRTNLIPQSQNINGKEFNGTVQLNIITAPDGTLTADSFDVNNSSNGGIVLTALTTTALTTYTLSAYLKGSVNGQKVLFYSDSQLTLAELTLTTDWKRYSITFTPNVTTTQSIYVLNGAYLSPSQNDLYYIWGAQFEVSQFVTEYIPTTTAAVTVQDGLNASRAVRLDRGVTDDLALNYAALLGAAGKYKLKFWAKTASESTSIKIMSDSTTFDEFTITNREYQKFEMELDALLADNQLRFFNTTENSSLIIDNVTIDLVEEGSNDSIPNPYTLDNEIKYFPLLVNGDKFRFYINADTPITGLTFSNLRLALYNSDGVRMYSDSNINSLTVGAGIHIYSNDITLSLSSYPDGIYYWALIDIATGTTKYSSNYFRLVSSGYNDYSTIIEYSHYKTMYNYRYSSVSFSNKFRVHILLSDIVYGGEISEYQEISTGTVRKTSTLKQRIYKVETYYFDRDAHEAMQIMCEHNNININNKAYLAKGVYSPNIEQISNVSKGEAEFIDQEYSQLNN